MSLRTQRDLAIAVAMFFAVLCIVLVVKGDLMTLRYVGSTTSDKYHKPSCEYAEKIYDGYLIYFDSVEAAERAGRTPCALCLG